MLLYKNKLFNAPKKLIFILLLLNSLLEIKIKKMRLLCLQLLVFIFVIIGAARLENLNSKIILIIAAVTSLITEFLAFVLPFIYSDRGEEIQTLNSCYAKWIRSFRCIQILCWFCLPVMIVILHVDDSTQWNLMGCLVLLSLLSLCLYLVRIYIEDTIAVIHLNTIESTTYIPPFVPSASVPASSLMPSRSPSSSI